MPGMRNQPVWVAALPDSWPELPSEMSVSLLTELESCPRRWALSRANYPNIWGRGGYPPKLQLSGLSGTVVHLAVAKITAALVRARCPSTRAPEAAAVMKELGGSSALLVECIDRVLGHYTGNPRATHLIEVSREKLRSYLPEMRAQVQSLLGRVNLEVEPQATDGEPSSRERFRGPLQPGVYPEVDVRATKIGWRGTVDLLAITQANCQIVDFKTGAPNEHHKFQLRVYALLWSRDSVLNPTHRSADQLKIAYRSGDAIVDAPTSSELNAIESDLIERTTIAKVIASNRPPEARPSPETCRFCQVRQLCNDYWLAIKQGRMGEIGDSVFADVELTVKERRGPSSWDGFVTAAIGRASGTRILLRMAQSGVPRFGPDDHLRVLDAHVLIPQDEAEPSVVTLGLFSETFLVPYESSR